MRITPQSVPSLILSKHKLYLIHLYSEIGPLSSLKKRSSCCCERCCCCCAFSSFGVVVVARGQSSFNARGKVVCVMCVMRMRMSRGGLRHDAATASMDLLLFLTAKECLQQHTDSGRRVYREVMESYGTTTQQRGYRRE